MTIVPNHHSNQQPCPSCHHTAFEQLLDMGSVPASGCFLPDNHHSVALYPLTFELCTHCGLVRQGYSDRPTLDYTHVNRNTKRQLPSYGQQILDSFHQVSDPDQLVIEVGANDGTFLNCLAAANFRHCLGIEPSIALSASCREQGHMVETTHLNHDEALRIRQRYGPAAIVLCRHTLEHVPDPLELVIAMRSLLAEDGLLFIEVPDAQDMAVNGKGQDLWDEHLHYFTAENLTLLVQQAGFSVERITLQDHRQSMNILCWCRPSPTKPMVDTSFDDRLKISVAQFRQFAQKWQLRCQQLQHHAPAWPSPVIAIGASHPQSNFLLFTGLGQYIDALVDDDPHKIGKYVPLPQPVPVISTAQLIANKPPGTILKTAFGYDGWMNKICKPMSDQGVHIVSL
ncbi:MAG: class I SAM-dependent methyltransferase [Cyanobacteria bacterium]|nr:class I SAM-dependent methyltransferase [Cyanobacteriota bacterium]MDW8200089.1 methyltransferase domain-containing protein [Cyanobacteriota bacterium SKYGB_h_bin112]